MQNSQSRPSSGQNRLQNEARSGEAMDVDNIQTNSIQGINNYSGTNDNNNNDSRIWSNGNNSDHRRFNSYNGNDDFNFYSNDNINEFRMFNNDNNNENNDDIASINHLDNQPEFFLSTRLGGLTNNKINDF